MSAYFVPTRFVWRFGGQQVISRWLCCDTSFDAPAGFKMGRSQRPQLAYQESLYIGRSAAALVRQHAS